MSNLIGFSGTTHIHTHLELTTLVNRNLNSKLFYVAIHIHLSLSPHCFFPSEFHSPVPTISVFCIVSLSNALQR